MSHANIYYLSHSPEEEVRLDDCLIVDEILGADSANIKTLKEFKDSIEEFNDYYGTSLKVVEKEEGLFYAEISKGELEKIKEKTKENIIRNLQEVKEPIEKIIKELIEEKGIEEELGGLGYSLWRLSHLLYPINGNMFYVEGWGIISNPDLYDFLLDNQKSGNPLYITAVFDYHY